MALSSKISNLHTQALCRVRSRNSFRQKIHNLTCEHFWLGCARTLGRLGSDAEHVSINTVFSTYQTTSRHLFENNPCSTKGNQRSRRCFAGHVVDSAFARCATMRPPASSSLDEADQQREGVLCPGHDHITKAHFHNGCSDLINSD